MNTTALAAIVAAGTALVLAPIDPRPLHNPCRRHADAVEIDSQCFDCIREEADIERIDRDRAETELATKVRTALGLPGHGRPIRDAGETAVRVCMWDQVELNTVYERVGGTVTTRTVQRTGSCSTWEATEITVTLDLPGIGAVEVFTDWYEEYGGRELPLMRALNAPKPEILETVPANGCLLGYDRYAIAPGAPLPDGRTIATVEDPLGSCWRVTDDHGGVHHLHRYGRLIRYTSGAVVFIEPEWAGWSSD